MRVNGPCDDRRTNHYDTTTHKSNDVRLLRRLQAKCFYLFKNEMKHAKNQNHV